MEENNNNIIISEKHIKKRHKNIKILITFITLIFLLAGGTFAWYSWNASDIGVDFVINSNIRIAVDGGVDITGKELYPTLDYTDTNYAITKTIKSWLLDPNDANNSTFNLKLNVMGISDNLKNSSFRWRIHKNGELKASGNFASVSTGASINLITNQIATTSKDIYTLYIYIDGSVDNDPSMAGGTYNFRLVAEGANAELVEVLPEPNSPDLVQGLIPVVYNEETSTWVKADETNNKNSWYDYTNKKWANAVLVSENGTRYTTTDKTVDISNNITSSPGYLSNNQNVGNSTATSTFTITTGTETGTLSFDYTVSSESCCDKLAITVNGTTIANVGGEQSKTYSVSTTANTTYTIVATYKKDSSVNSGADTASISNIIMPTGSTMTITNGDTYYFAEGTEPVTKNHNQIGTYFTYENNKYVLKSVTSGTAISSLTVGKYICPDITQTECTTVYKVTEAGTNIAKVTEYTDVSTVNGVRTTYQNAEAGTEINDSDILAFYVWIPRYKYKVWNINKVIGTDSYNARTTGIDIRFEEGTVSTGDITCTNYSFAAPSSTAGSPNETCTGSNGQYYTHPAFTFGDNQIKGFWIGKFELSSETPYATNGGGNTSTLTPRILPNVISWRHNYLSNFNTVIQNMQTSNNIYGLSTDKSLADSHMIKNMEWGAVLYLTNSDYGRCTDGTCTKVTINNCSSFITGVGGDTVSAGESSTTCTTDANKYSGVKGVLASTTGNIYGVYDMSGGSVEMVMGNMSSVTEAYTFYSSNSEFASSWYSNYSNRKYVNTYANGSTKNDQTAYNRARLGDATGEIVLSSDNAWDSNNAQFLYSRFSWFIRGGFYLYASYASAFTFSVCDGSLSYTFSTRAALVGL